MSKFFSVVTCGFYAGELKGDYDLAGTWPLDAVSISDEEEIEIRSQLEIRSTPVFGADGAWTFIAYAPSVGDIRQQVELKKMGEMALASEKINILVDATDQEVVSHPSETDVALLLAWKKYRQALRTMDTAATDVVWPDRPALL